MTEPQTITTDHVRALLDSDGDGASLRLIEGRVEVLDAGQLDTDEYRGALEVISRAELVESIGDDPTDDQLTQQADSLTASVQLLGG